MTVQEKKSLRRFIDKCEQRFRYQGSSLPESLETIRRYVDRYFNDAATQQLEPIKHELLTEALKDSVVAYWQARVDRDSEPSAFLIDLVDYVEKRSLYWFSYQQERWLK